MTTKNKVAQPLDGVLGDMPVTAFVIPGHVDCLGDTQHPFVEGDGA